MKTICIYYVHSHIVTIESVRYAPKYIFFMPTFLPGLVIMLCPFERGVRYILQVSANTGFTVLYIVIKYREINIEVFKMI